MFEIYNDCEFRASSGFSWWTLLPIVTSLATIVCTFWFIFYTKRVELISLKFQKIGIANIESLFKPIDDLFSEEDLDIKKQESRLTALFVEIQLFITQLKTIYVQINTGALVAIIEEFTDFIYQPDTPTVTDARGKYNVTKALLINALYDYALNKEFNVLERIFQRKKSKTKTA
jgi:hypothetical protein